MGEGPHNGNVRGNRTWWFEHITISNWHLHGETNNGSEMTNCGVRFGFMEGIGKNRMGVVMSTDVQVDMTSIMSDRRFTGPNSMAIGRQLFSSHFHFMAKLCNTFSGCNQKTLFDFRSVNRIDNEADQRFSCGSDERNGEE